MQERLWADYNFDGQMFMRRTDDRRIETRKDIRLKQIDMKISNKDNMLQFGDFYGEFSQFTLGQSLEGLNLKVSHPKGQTYRAVAARKSEADEAADIYQTNVFGGMADYTFSNESGFPYFNLGTQAVTTQGDKGSIDDKETPATDMNNTVFSVDGELRPVENFGVTYEVAQSGARNNEKDPNEDMRFGSAFRVQPELKVDNLRAKYLYYYVTPKFYTDVGSAMPDKEQHQFNFDWKILRWLSVSLIENYYWDHLPGSSRTLRTTNDEKYMSAYIRPFRKSPSFTIRPYVNLLNRNSDDLYNTLESDTNTYGVSFNDSTANGMFNYGLGYEHREYKDLANNNTGSELYNRVIANGGMDIDFFGRRLYLSDDISLDFRSSKADSDAEVTVANSASIMYDFHDICSLRAANNVQQFDGSAPGTNLTNTRNYAELIFTFDKKRSFRWILRAERNMYRHEDGSQSYTEDRAIMKAMTNF